MTIEELNKYEDRLKELKILIENTIINIEFYPRMNCYKEELMKYTKEVKDIKKILEKAKKEKK